MGASSKSVYLVLYTDVSLTGLAGEREVLSIKVLEGYENQSLLIIKSFKSVQNFSSKKWKHPHRE